MTKQLDIWQGDGVPKEKAKGSGFLSWGDQAKLRRDIGWEFWKDSRREVSALPWFIPGLGGAQASNIQVIAPVFLNLCIPGVLCNTVVILLAPERLATHPHPGWQAWKVEAGWKNCGFWGPTLALSLAAGQCEVSPTSVSLTLGCQLPHQFHGGASR